MSEKFYEKLLSFFFSLAILLILIFATVQFLIIYFQTQNLIFYFAYLGILLFSGLYGIKYYLAFRDFKANLCLFIPNSETEKPIEPLSMEFETIPLKVCLYYRNGATYEQIEQNLGLKHPNQVKRELIKGLDILLREHNEKKVGSCHN